MYELFANYVHSLKVATGEKEPRPGAQTRGLRYNAELQPHEPLVWPQFFISNRRIYIQAVQLAKSSYKLHQLA